tara:strand:+ start:5089 stop:5454 length:366 start_codon:yes stop_codon:yes gene_type:complete
MNAFYLGEALNALRPNSAFGCGETYDSIEWYSTNSGTKPLQEEVEAKIRELQQLEPYRLLRIERDRLLKETDWMANSDVIISDEWKTYRQALRDLPATSTPKLNNQEQLDESSVTWPTPPS